MTDEHPLVAEARPIDIDLVALEAMLCEALAALRAEHGDVVTVTEPFYTAPAYQRLGEVAPDSEPTLGSVSHDWERVQDCREEGDIDVLAPFALKWHAGILGGLAQTILRRGRA